MNKEELHDNNEEKVKEEDEGDREVDDSGNEGDIWYVTVFVICCTELGIQFKPPITVCYSRVPLLFAKL